MKRKQERLSDAEDRKLVDEFLKDAKANQALPWYIAACLTFRDTEKLLEHTRVLKIWTIVLAFTSVALMLLAIAQIVAVILVGAGII